MLVMSRILGLICFGFSLVGCQRARPEKFIRLNPLPYSIQDDLALTPLVEAAGQSLIRFEKGQKPLKFGKLKVEASRYASFLNEFLALVDRASRNSSEWKALNNLDWVTPQGLDGGGSIFLTSYYEPVIAGSRVKEGVLTQALYRRPKDLVEVGISFFDQRFDGIRMMRGRLMPPQSADEKISMLPYFSRREIDEKGMLQNKKLEVVWVDPIDAFFLHIQGSGTVELADGSRVLLRYADQNGHQYQSIGKFLRDKIPAEKLNSMEIEKYLRSLDANAVSQILYKNPSYVFFEEKAGKPITAWQTEVVSGRTIATDVREFPPGAIGLLIFESPVFTSPEATEPAFWTTKTRLVLNHDTGGAIKGGARVDLFWGSGDDAKRHASWIRHRARLYFPVPIPKGTALLPAP